MARFLVLGSARQDIYLSDHEAFHATGRSFDRLAAGKSTEIEQIIYTVGGEGLVSATALARHGHEVVLLSQIGDDVAGRAISEALDRENIDTSYLSDTPTSASAVILLNGRQRTIITAKPTVRAHFSVADLNLVQPDWLFVNSLDGDMHTLRSFLEQAHQNQVKTLFAPSSAELSQPKKLLGLLEDTDLLCLNKTSAAQLVPGTILSELLYRLLNYTPVVIITDGPMGGIAGTRASAYRFGIYEDVEVLDRSGASTAFYASFLAHLTSGHTFKSSLIFASAAATSVITKIGVLDGLLSGSEPLHPMPIQKL